MEHTGQAAGVPSPSAGRSRRGAALLTAAMGIVHALLFVLSFLILRSSPKPESSDAEVVDYYTTTGGRWMITVGMYLIPFAAIAFIWFIVALRMWVSRHGRPEHQLFSNIQLIAGIAYTVMFLAAGAAFAVAGTATGYAHRPAELTLMRQFPHYGQVLALVLAMRMAAMFVLTTASVSRHSKVLPTWFTLMSYPVGLFLLLAASLNAVLIVVFPVWVLTLCVLLILRARRTTGHLTEQLP